VIQAVGGARSPRSEPGVPPLPVDRGAGEGPVPWADRRFWDVVPFRDAVLTVVVVALVVGGCLFGYWVRSIIGPVLVALILAYLSNPVIDALGRRRVPRVVSAGVLAALIVAVEVLVVLWLGPLLFRQTVSLTRQAPRIARQLSGAIERKYDVRVPDELTRPIEELAPERAPAPGEAGAEPGAAPGAAPGAQRQPAGVGGIDVSAGMRVLRWAAGGSDALAGTIMGVVGVATYVAVTAILFPIYVFLIAWHLPGLGRAITFVPRRRRAETLRIVGLMNDTVNGFFLGRFVVSLIMAGLFWAGWALCGVPYAGLLGVSTGLLNVVPWASGIGWPLAVGLTYADSAGHGSFDPLHVFLWPSLVYGFVQGLDGWLLTPMIQSRTVDLSAFTVLIVVFIGGFVGGVAGLVLAVPLTACVKILLRELVGPRLREWAEAH
jgi:predicted PurR-regulated permease PerM